MAAENRQQLREETIVRLCEVLESARSSGLSENDVKTCLETEQFLGSPHRHKKHLKWRLLSLHCWVFNILPVVFFLSLLYFPLSELLSDSPCLIYQPTPFSEFLHPIADCSVCEGIVEAPRIANLSQDEFVRKYAYSSRPIVVAGAAMEWSAVEVFSYEYFKELYHRFPEAIESDTNMGQFFFYSSNIRDLQELFELSTERASMATEKWYIGWSTNDPNIGEELQKHFSPPYFIPPGSSELDLAWIFMGAPGPGASMHIDSVDLPSWQAQLSGVKTWTLAPPLECEHVCHRLNITVNRGDIIVVDTNWWYHATYIQPGNISITIGTEYQ